MEKRQPSLKKIFLPLCLAIVITVFALGLRVNLALNGPVEYDEPVYFRAAIYYARDILNQDWDSVIHSDYNLEHPPLVKLVDGLALSQTTRLTEYTPVPRSFPIRGQPDYVSLRNLRLVSAFFGSMAVFILSLVNPLAGLALAVHTFAVKYTSIIYLEALPLCGAVVCVAAFSKYEESHRSGWLILSAMACGLSLASKYVYGLAGISVFIYGLYRVSHPHPSYKYVPRHTQWMKIIVWGSLSLVFFFLADPRLWNNPLANLWQSMSFSTAYASQNNTELLKYGYPFWQPIKWLAQSIPDTTYQAPPFYFRPGDYLIAVDTIFLPLAGLGLWRLSKTSPIYFIWLLIGLLFLLFWNTKWPQYILVILPPYCLAAANGLAIIFGGFKRLYQRLAKN